MSPILRRPIVALVSHARDVPAPDRERFAATLRADIGRRGLIVETCHRVEAYTTIATEVDPAELESMVPAGGRVLHADEAIRHAVTVATGRDSVVLGEDQILHQLRGSLETARTSAELDPEVDRLFALALQAGRRARSWRTGRQRSLADVALDHVERITGPIKDREILVVGAGRMGDLVARAAATAGGSVTVANRSVERGGALATAVGGRTSDIDPGPGVGRFAAIVVGLGGPWLIDERTVAAILGGRPVVVDLSVPLAVPAALSDGLAGRMITADDLAIGATVAGSGSAEGSGVDGRPVADARTVRLIDQTVASFLDWQARGDARAAADALVRRADSEREAELAALWRKLPALDPDAREAIEGMTRHLAARLLRHPLERLGRDDDGTDGLSVRDLFAL